MLLLHRCVIYVTPMHSSRYAVAFSQSDYFQRAHANQRNVSLRFDRDQFSDYIILSQLRSPFPCTHPTEPIDRQCI